MEGARPLIALLLLASSASADPLADALARAEAADLRLRETGTCATEDVDSITTLATMLHADASPNRWIFPVVRVTPAVSIGGRNGDGWRPNRPKRCFATTNPGHPAHDLFVDDRDQDSRDAAGRPWDVRAVDDGIVAITRTGWTEGNRLKGGNYVMLYLPSLRAFAYYAHLDTIAVQPGTRVTRGTVLGTLGRTGVNAAKKRSPTHLHFGLYDAKTLAPVNPYARLRDAESTPVE